MTPRSLLIRNEPIQIVCLTRQWPLPKASKLAEFIPLAYYNFMQEYLRLGHMEPVPDKELDKQDVYYIPHHAVFHTGKIRVVFNASMPSSNGLSLNASLYTGRKLQQNTILVLIRWHCYRYVFTSDIVKMFRQFLVHPLDRDWHRIIYDFGRGIHHFRLSTITICIHYIRS